MPYTTLGFDDKAGWLAERQNSIGASEVAILTGDNPYQSRDELFRTRTVGSAKDLSKIVRVQAGVYLESYAVRLLADRLPEWTVTTTAYPWCLCRRVDNPRIHWSPDAFLHRGALIVPGEVKATKAASKWRGGAVPRLYWAQCQVACYVTNAPYAFIGAILNTDSFTEPRRIQRDQDWIDTAVECVDEFMQEIAQCTAR